MLDHRLTVPEPFRAEWEACSVPDPGPGEVLIRTRKTLISTGTELTAFTGDFPSESVWASYIKYPWRSAGYSNVGDVVALGPGVSEFEVDQRVCSSGRHAVYNIQALSQVQAVPDDVDDDQAVFWQLGCTVMNGVRRAGIALGESVVLVGAGILGQLATQYVCLNGAYPVIAVDLSELRLRMARSHGATNALIGGWDDILDEIGEITRGKMADVAFEITGNQEVIPQLFRMVRRLGRVVLLGSPRGKVAVDFHDEVHTLGLEVIGAHVSTHPEAQTPYNPWVKARNGELFFDLVRTGRLRLDLMITHRYHWQEAPEAYRMLAGDRSQAMGVVLEGWDE